MVEHCSTTISRDRARKDRISHTDKVTVLEVEAVQLVARLFCIHHVFIDDEGGPLGIACNALSNLSAWGVNSSSTGGKGKPYRMGPYFPNRSNNSSGVTL